MARYTSVELLQKHLRIDFLEEGDSEYLESLLNACEERIEKEIEQPLAVFAGEDGKLNPALVYAILVLSATLYANREAVAYSNAVAVPYTLGFLIQPYRKYT